VKKAKETGKCSLIISLREEKFENMRELPLSSHQDVAETFPIPSFRCGEQ
jgi:hypothetical protein